MVATEGFPYRIKAFPGQRAWQGDEYVGISAAIATLDGRAEVILHNPLVGQHTDWYQADSAFYGSRELPYLGFALMADSTSR